MHSPAPPGLAVSQILWQGFETVGPTRSEVQKSRPSQPRFYHQSAKNPSRTLVTVVTVVQCHLPPTRFLTHLRTTDRHTASAAASEGTGDLERPAARKRSERSERAARQPGTGRECPERPARDRPPGSGGLPPTRTPERTPRAERGAVAAVRCGLRCLRWSA